MMRFVFALVLLSGCFNPKFKDQIACGANGECPPGRSCGADNMCHADEPGDALTIDAPIDAQPDAPPVECMTTTDCQTPPDACTVNGVCDTVQHKCVFQPRDCSAMADECNDGACNVVTGCGKAPAHQGVACGAGNTCPAFGACGGFSGTCDSTGTQSRTCTMFTCQAGTCGGTDYNDSQACTRVTNGVSCGTTTVSGCGACFGSTQSGCAADGRQTCTCTAQTCMADACTPQSSSCTQATNCKTLLVNEVCSIQACANPPSTFRDICCNATGSCSVACGPCLQ